MDGILDRLFQEMRKDGHGLTAEQEKRIKERMGYGVTDPDGPRCSISSWCAREYGHRGECVASLDELES
jgi:hypothetical protein